MTGRAILTLGFLHVMSALLLAQGSDLTLDEGIRLYWSGEYEHTIGLLQNACAMESDAGEKIDCHKYLAFSHIALGEEREAELQFIELLAADPAHALDSELVSPKIMKRFYASRRQLANRLYAEGKQAYYRQEFVAAADLMDRILLLEPEDELAREYRQLCEERIRMDNVSRVEAAKQRERAPEPSPENKVYRLTSDIRRPVLVEQIAPEYPRNDRLRRVEGSVVLTVVIDERGFVRESKVVRSVSDSIDRAAVEAVSQWRYRPGSRNGAPVAVHGVVMVHFELEGS